MIAFFLSQQSSLEASPVTKSEGGEADLKQTLCSNGIFRYQYRWKNRRKNP